MHLGAITNLATHLLPILSTTPAPSKTLTFEPIHAFGHSPATHHRPRLLLQNASSPTSFLFTPPDINTLSSEDAMEHLMDYPAPHLLNEPLTIRTKPITIRRPRIKPPSMLSWAYSARRNNRPPGTEILPYSARPRKITEEEGNSTWIAPDYSDAQGDWEDVEVQGPDITDRQTLLTLAKMMSNAYVEVTDGGEWWPLGKQWNATTPFGWEPDADGLRGHVVSGARGMQRRHSSRLVCRSDQFDSHSVDQRDICGSSRIRRIYSQERQVQCELDRCLQCESS